jgi:hypothetical protein
MRNTSDGVFGERRPMSDTPARPGRKPSTCPAARLTNMKNRVYWRYEMEREGALRSKRERQFAW